MHGFQINPKLGRQEWLARQGAAVPVRAAEGAYGTGWDISASDAQTYVLLQIISHAAPQTVEPQQCAATSFWSQATQEFTAGWPTRLHYHCYKKAEHAQTLASSPVTPAGIVDLVRQTFVLSVSDAAEVFRVSRPTIYQWSKLESLELVRASDDRERLKKLYGVVTAWAARPALRGQWYLHILPSGETVHDLLKGDRLDSAEFARIHTVLEQQSNVLHAKEHAKARRAAENLRAAAARMEADQPSPANGRQSDPKAKGEI